MKTDSQGKKCPLCIENGMMQTIIADDDEAYLCRRVEAGEVKMNEYMLVPKMHVESEPPMWLYGRTAWLQKIGVTADNLYVNLTEDGGRLLGHAHLHLIVRTDGRRLGMNGLIKLVDQLEVGEAALRNQIAALEGQVAELQQDLTNLRRRSGLQLTGN